VWLILLPFTLWAAYSWFSILLSGIFAFLMFGIDEIGVQIEEPFGWVFLSCSVLPLEAICSTIERNIRELLSRNYEVAALVRAQNLPLGASSGSEGEQQAGLDLDLEDAGGGAGHAGHAGLALALQAAAVGGQGGEFEFGEMTDASLDPAKGGSALGGGGSVVSLSAASGAAAARRVQFSGAAVIDMPPGAGGGADGGGSADGGGGNGGGQRGLNRMASLIEVELASGAAPAGLSPREAGAGPGYSWLHD
jgi:hypothetical protein